MLELVAAITEILLTAGLGGQAVAFFVAIQALWLSFMTLGSVGLAIRPNKVTSAHTIFEIAKQERRWFKAAAYGLMAYTGNNWLAIDRAMYVKWFAGDPNGTISGGIGKAMISGHNNIVFRIVNAVTSFLDPHHGSTISGEELEHMKKIGLNPDSTKDVEWYKSSHCIRAINPYAGRGAGRHDRRIWQ